MSEKLPSAHDVLGAAGFVGPAAAGIEELAINAVLWLKLGVEGTGALVIGVGAIIATWQFVCVFLRGNRGITIGSA